MNIYVGNLALDIAEEEIRREFAVFGQVLSVNLMNDKYFGSGQTHGYAFVKMTAKPEGDVAVATLNGKMMRGRVINVIEALPLSGDSEKVSVHTRSNRFSGSRRQRNNANQNQVSSHIYE